MTILEFVFYSFWRFAGFAFLLYLVLYFVVNGLLRFFARLFRVISVASRGWPPPHLDADGDFKGSSVKEINPISE